mmetsp:Transcript_21949/g.50168  ORF Transcript_21949/g.50168 Transcript_21949/m.50168 type:complete len:98 (-) Transcript_21949:174-467(-)
MSASQMIQKTGLTALQEASDKAGHYVDTYGGCASGEMGASIRSNVPVPGQSKVAAGTWVTFSMGAGGSGKTKGQLQAERLGSRYGPNVKAPAFLMKV